MLTTEAVVPEVARYHQFRETRRSEFESLPPSQPSLTARFARSYGSAGVASPESASESPSIEGCRAEAANAVSVWRRRTISFSNPQVLAVWKNSNARRIYQQNCDGSLLNQLVRVVLNILG